MEHFLMCIDAKDANGITAGAIYQVHRQTYNDKVAPHPKSVQIIDDNGEVSSYHINRFIEVPATKVLTCIDDSDAVGITKGKCYDLIDSDDFYYKIVNDHGIECWYIKYRFRMEYRPTKVFVTKG